MQEPIIINIYLRYKIRRKTIAKAKNSLPTSMFNSTFEEASKLLIFNFLEIALDSTLFDSSTFPSTIIIVTIYVFSSIMRLSAMEVCAAKTARSKKKSKKIQIY